MGKEKTLDKGILWVISRMSFNIVDLPKYDAVLNLFTFPIKRQHCFFPRYYKVKNIFGKTIIEGEAIWALIDKDTRTIVDPVKNNIMIKSYPFEKELGVSLTFPVKECKNNFFYTVKTSDLDLNNHMTNTRYSDLIIDLLPSSFYKNKMIKSFAISFFKEIDEGENIKLSYSYDNNYLFVRGILNNLKAFESYIEFVNSK
jgi:acyl-ACP thioesterase